MLASLLTVAVSVQVLGYEGLLGTLGVAVLGFPAAWLLNGSDPGEPPLLDVQLRPSAH